ncbi:MAG: UbiD family decarboxylase [Deltaproteobacteria bacterium]|nr:UbiD family decarboxylase [Deltaproteobacteria bacterium]
MAYRDLREYLARLDALGKLHHIREEVDKDWEIAAITRRVFQRIPDARRPALLFERVKGFTIPVVVGVLGGSVEIYAAALECRPEETADRWQQAYRNPIPPKVVEGGPCKEVVLKGEQVNLLRFPVPVWSVGHDPGPYLTAPLVCSVDPVTGVRNVGTYRVQVKEAARAAMMVNWRQHMRTHITLNEEQGHPTPAAIVLGADPTVGLVSVSKVPYDMDEFAVAGGLRGAPIELVRCETNDLEVPAAAEIVIEGEIPANVREPEGPFGEYTGYMGAGGHAFAFRVTCITHRRDPIFHAFLSQMPPSESSTIRGYGRERAIMKVLRQAGIRVRDVHMTHSGGGNAVLLISFKPEYPGQVQQVVWTAWSVDPTLGKFTIVVDDDIDVHDHFQVEAALSFRVRPDRDIYIASAPYSIPQEAEVRARGSKVAIDATKKHEYPPLSLPPEDHLLEVDRRWSHYGLAGLER